MTVGSDRVSGSLFTGVLDGCATFSVLSGCLVASAGSFSARSETVSVPTTRHAFFFDLGARVGARVPPLAVALARRVHRRTHSVYPDRAVCRRADRLPQHGPWTGTLGVGPVFQIW